MELVYLWVEDYKNIHKQGFNFSPRFECKFYPDYDRNGRLTDNSKLEIVEKDYVNIFPENINITAIVGKNGSGKSSLIENIINDIIFNEKIEYDEQPLYCYLNDKKDKMYINSYLLSDHNIKSDVSYKLTHIESDTDENEYLDCDFSDIKKLIDFKNEYDKSFFYFYNNRLEVDNNAHQIYKYNEELLFYSEIDKTDDLINLEKENDKTFNNLISLLMDNSRLPKEISNIFVPIKMYINREDVFIFLEHFKNEESDYRYFIEERNTADIIKLETLIYLRYFLNKNSFNSKWKEYTMSLLKIFEGKHLIEEYKIILDNILIILQEMYFKIEFEKKDIRYDDNKSNDYYLEKILELEKVYIILQNPYDLALLISSKRNNYFYDYEIDISKLNNDTINIFKNMPAYLTISFTNSIGKRYNELSSGEKNILKLLFSIKNIIDLRQNRTYSFNILLDEIEDTLHPAWQKKLISWLIYFFSNFKNIQLNFIITTHSPFLISDLPKENIIFLDTYKELEEEVINGEQKAGNCKVLSKDEVLEKKQTFGANIHTLLSDSFFMKDGLMGEFAKSKINEIKMFYEKIIEEKKTGENIYFYNQNQEKFWQIQKIIGEPFLQKIVKNQLEEIELILLGKDEAIDNEIARLQALKESLR